MDTHLLRPCHLPSRFVASGAWGLNAQARRHSRRSPVVRASLTSKGQQFPADLINVKKIMGEGAYGQVFEGAEMMGQMEHLLNVYASKAAKGSIADFVGYIEVSEAQATTKLTQGVWLMWKYEGQKTLSYYLKRRDCLEVLSEDLGVDKSAVVATVMKQILEGIAALHTAGLVHRDIKPMNIIFAEQQKRFKLIDLGACADLRTGTNYIPDESILDPTYCPPEQYCMPTDSPHLSKHGAFAMAMSPLLWQRFKPDRFDSYSAGLCMMQLALGKVRTGVGLTAFNKALKHNSFDLMAWRRRAGLSARETAVLDADDGAGWELAEALLRPREIDVDAETGTVRFVNTNQNAVRLGVSLALTHKFMKQAQQPSGVSDATRRLERLPFLFQRGSSSSSTSSDRSLERAAAADAAVSQPASSSGQGGMLGMAMGVWRKATSKLFDLEAKIANQASAVTTQTARVQLLQAQAATGKVSVAKLEKEQGILSKMTGRLAGLTSEFNSTAQSANRLLGSLMNRNRDAPVPETPEAKPQPTAPPQTSRRRSDMPPSLQWGSNSSSSSLQRAQQQEEELSEAADQALASTQQPPRSAWPRAERSEAALERPKTVRPKLAKKSKAQEEESQEPESATTSGQSGVTGAGVNMLYAGLKFTGLALNVAGDMAKSMRQEAERALKDMEAEAAAKKLAKETASEFVDMLREARPPVTSDTSFVAIRRQCSADKRWQALTDSKREQVFDTYLAAVIKMEEAAYQQAIADFKIMLSQSGLAANSEWGTVKPQLASLAAFTALKSDQDRQQLFEDYVSNLQMAAEQARAVAQYEEDFWGLLESQDPPLTPSSSWLPVRRQISQDTRFMALPEKRCRQLFNQYHSNLKDLEASARLQAQLEAAASAQPSTSSDEEPQQQQQGPGQGLAELTEQAWQKRPGSPRGSPGKAGRPDRGQPAQSEALDALRQEQARMKAEYNRMEAKLVEMEARLRIKEAGQEEEGPSNAAVLNGKMPRSTSDGDLVGRWSGNSSNGAGNVSQK